MQLNPYTVVANANANANNLASNHPHANSPEEGECLSDDGDGDSNNVLELKLKQPPYVNVQQSLQKRAHSSSTAAAPLSGKIKFNLVVKPQNKSKSKSKSKENSKESSTNLVVNDVAPVYKAAGQKQATFMSQQVSIPNYNTTKPNNVFGVVDHPVQQHPTQGIPSVASLHPSRWQKPNTCNSSDDDVSSSSSRKSFSLGSSDSLIDGDVVGKDDDSMRGGNDTANVAGSATPSEVAEVVDLVSDDDNDDDGDKSESGSSMDIESSDGDDDDTPGHSASNYNDTILSGKGTVLAAADDTSSPTEETVLEDEKPVGRAKMISALRQPLVIRNISKIGPLNLVRIMNKSRKRIRMNAVALNSSRNNNIVRSSTSKLSDATNTTSGVSAVVGKRKAESANVLRGDAKKVNESLLPANDDRKEVNQQNRSEELEIKIARMKERMLAAKEQKSKATSEIAPGTNVVSDDVLPKRDDASVEGPSKKREIGARDSADTSVTVVKDNSAGNPSDDASVEGPSKKREIDARDSADTSVMVVKENSAGNPSEKDESLSQLSKGTRSLEMLNVLRAKKALLAKKQKLLEKQRASAAAAALNQQATAPSLSTTKDTLITAKAAGAVQASQLSFKTTLEQVSTAEMKSKDASCPPMENNESGGVNSVPIQELVAKKDELINERKRKAAESRSIIVDIAKARKEQREICKEGRKKVADLEFQRDSLEKLLMQASKKLVDARKRVTQAKVARPRGSDRLAADFF